MSTSRWTALIVNYNSVEYLAACIDALEANTSPPAEVLVVDNASSDGSVDVLRGDPRVRLLAQSQNLGFAGGANAGLAAVTTEFALLLNPDVVVEPTFGAELVAAFDRDPEVGVVGPLLLFPESDRMQHAGGWLILPLVHSNHRGYAQPISPEYLEETDVDYVIGSAMGLRMCAVRAVGGFDERFFPAYFEDLDLCVTLRAAGWRTRYIPAMRGVHHEGVVLRGSPAQHRFMYANRLRFAMKHLTPEQWRTEFIPTEIEDVRRRVAAAAGPWWAETSKATAIEAVLRNPNLAAAGTPSLPFDPEHFDRARAFLDQASAMSLPEPPPLERITEGPHRRDDIAAELGRLRRFAEDLRDRQQTVNRLIAGALAAQEQMHREQLALVLALALDALQYLPRRDATALAHDDRVPAAHQDA